MDVLKSATCADLLEKLTGYRPQTTVEEGVRALVEWYRDYWEKNGPLRL